jgi:hypothetical protein
MKMSESITELSAALAAAQGEMENASKTSTNPHFRSRYADLAEILNTIRPVFSKHGLAVVQSPSYVDGIVSVTTILTHSSGQWIMDTASAPASKLDPQGVGSATTYLRRYSLAGYAAIFQEDDDSNAASNRRPAGPDKAALEAAANMLRACQSLDELQTAFKSLTPDMRQAMNGIKDVMKELLS